MSATTTISKVQASGLSLLPYLQPSASSLWLRVPGPTSNQNAGPTFDESILKIGPVVDLIPIELMFDHRQVISRHHLVMQADHYRFSDIDPARVNNAAVASLWRRFVEGRRPNGTQESCGDHAFIQLPFDPDNGASICRPLFFCGFRHMFCHPLCPHCGKGLILCRDDEWLMPNHMPAYGDSMERFLYCSQCAVDDGTATFYTPSSIGSKVPAGKGNNVFSTQDLVSEWGGLLQSEKVEDFLPCQGCDEVQACFGSSMLVTRRMAAFRFFPFYMLLEPASLIPADDYMALLSGSAFASFQRPAMDKTALSVPDPVPDQVYDQVNKPISLPDNGADGGAANGERISSTGSNGASDHGQIRTILADILATWPEDLTDEANDVADHSLDNTITEIPPTDNGSFDDDTDSDVEETVVLTSSSDQSPAPVSTTDDTDALDRTVVVSSAGGGAAPADSPRPVGTESDLDKTVVLSPSAGHTPPVMPDVSEAEGPLDKTVVLTGAANAAKGDNLDRTVVVSPSTPSAPQAGIDHEDSGRDEDALDATVFLRPGERKKGKPSS